MELLKYLESFSATRFKFVHNFCASTKCEHPSDEEARVRPCDAPDELLNGPHVEKLLLVSCQVRNGKRCHAKDHKVSQRHTATFNKICLLVQKKESLRWELQILKQ